MTEKIQKVPFGLNELLRIQQSGAPPDQLSEVYIPTIEATDFFGALNLVGASTFATGKGVRGDTVSLTVPQGEVWRLLNVTGTFQSFSLVGATIRAKLAIAPIAAATGATAISGVVVATIGFDYAAGTPISNVADIVDFGAMLPVPLVLLPGSVISNTLEQSSAAGTYEMDLRVMYQKLAY